MPITSVPASFRTRRHKSSRTWNSASPLETGGVTNRSDASMRPSWAMTPAASLVPPMSMASVLSPSKLRPHWLCILRWNANVCVSKRSGMVDWWTEVGRATSAFLDQHGLLAAFVFLLIEEAGVPVPVPGDVLMLILGLHARQGTVPLWQAVAATWLGTMIGSTFLYFAARIAGRDLVYRYGPFIRLTPERLDRAERWLKHHGSRAVFLGRLVPGLRIVTAVACGVFEVPFGVFFPAMSLGALLYIVVYTLLGYYLGPPVLTVLEKIHIPFGLLGSLVPLALILLWTYRTRQGLGRRTAPLPVDREQHLRAGAIAGGLAT